MEREVTHLRARERETGLASANIIVFFLNSSFFTVLNDMLYKKSFVFFLNKENKNDFAVSITGSYRCVR